MDPYGFKLLEISSNGFKRLPIAPNSSKWMEIALNGSKWHQMAGMASTSTFLYFKPSITYLNDGQSDNIRDLTEGKADLPF